MEEESQSDPAFVEPPEVLNIHIYRPSCRSILEIGLLILVLIPLVIIGIALFHPRFRGGDVWGAIVGFEVFFLILLAVFAFVASISDAISGRHAEKRREILTALGQSSATEEFELHINLLAKKRNRKIHLEASDMAMSPRPSAVFLSSLEQKDWPMPRPCNIPFEPIPLGRDPHRTALLLDEFVDLPIGGGSVSQGPVKRIRNWYRNLPATTRKWFDVCPVLLFCTFMGLTGRMSVEVLLVPVLLFGSLIAVYVSTELSAPAGWLFPGLVATKAKGKTRVLRRCRGILWYDALEKVLWVPSEDGQFVKLKCEPQDGLLAIWAWLNTADPPDHIHLDNIA